MTPRSFILTALLALGAVLVGAAPAGGQTLCPDGTYVSEGPCTRCPDGTYVSAADSCVLTPEGDYVPNRPGGPRVAPDGTYVPGGADTTLCPDGTYVSGARCVLTPDGTYVGE